MITSKAFAIVLVVTACQAVPVWVGEAWRNGRSPSVAFGFGSGFSSDIGGIRHSSGVGASFQSGNGRAIGSGFGSTGGNAYTQGVGIAKAAPAYPQHRPQIQPIYNNFGSASSSSQNYGAGSSSAQSHSNVQYPAMRALPLYNTAVSSAHGSRGQGYHSAVSAAQSGSGLQHSTALSAARSHNGASDYGSAVSFAHNAGGVQAGAAEALQRRDGLLQHAGASSISTPGLQSAHAHSINAGGYY